MLTAKLSSVTMVQRGETCKFYLRAPKMATDINPQMSYPSNISKLSLMVRKHNTTDTMAYSIIDDYQPPITPTYPLKSPIE